jgi:hypothetical protein
MSFKNELVLLRSYLDEAELHLEKLESGTKASSSKARVALFKIKTLAHELRKQITEKLKSLPTKTRPKKVAEPEKPAEPEQPEPEKVSPVPITKVKKVRVKKVVKSS